MSRYDHGRAGEYRRYVLALPALERNPVFLRERIGAGLLVVHNPEAAGCRLPSRARERNIVCRPAGLRICYPVVRDMRPRIPPLRPACQAHGATRPSYRYVRAPPDSGRPAPGSRTPDALPPPEYMPPQQAQPKARVPWANACSSQHVTAGQPSADHTSLPGRDIGSKERQEGGKVHQGMTHHRPSYGVTRARHEGPDGT